MRGWVCQDNIIFEYIFKSLDNEKLVFTGDPIGFRSSQFTVPCTSSDLLDQYRSEIESEPYRAYGNGGQPKTNWGSVPYEPA